jgi:hypothetical protein
MDGIIENKEQKLPVPKPSEVKNLIDELAKTLPDKEIKEEVLIKEAYLS